MEINPLKAISPIDGRYRKQTKSLESYFSEYALIKYRLFVEIKYFIALLSAQIKVLAMPLHRLWRFASVKEQEMQFLPTTDRTGP